MKNALVLNLSKSPISTNEDGYREISPKEFWKQFLRLTRSELSVKELDVLSDYLTDVKPKVPNTVITSLTKKGYLVDKELSQNLVKLKENIKSQRVKLVFNYELHGTG